MEWYPLGRILLWTAGFAVLTTMAALFTLGSDGATIAAALRRGLLRMFQATRVFTRGLFFAAPAGGFVDWADSPIGAIRSLVLPSLALGLVQAAVLTRYIRSAIVDVQLAPRCSDATDLCVGEEGDAGDVRHRARRARGRRRLARW